MDEILRQSVLISYYSRLMKEREAGRPCSQYRHVIAFENTESRHVVVEEAWPPGEDDQWVGPYRLLEHIGRGGDSDVWLAWRPDRGEFAAVKLPAAGAAPDPCRAAYAQELAVSGRIKDAGLRPALELLEHEGAPALVLEYVDGRSLRDAIADSAAGPVRVAEASNDVESLRNLIGFFEACCTAVEQAHEAGFVHGDLKPANILVTPEGRPVVLDFGAAVALEGATPDELDHGTLAYMAPERLDASLGPCDRRLDVYGLAATLFEALTLRRPHSGPTVDSLVQAIVSEAPASAVDVAPTVPRSLARVLDAALATRPDRRTPSCGAFAKALARERRRIGRRPAGGLARAAVIAVVMIVALLVGLELRGGGAGESPKASSRPDVAALVDEGYMALDDLEPAKAIESFEEVLARQPDCVEAVAGIAWAHLRRNEPAAATEIVERFEERFGRSKGLEILRIMAAGETDPSAGGRDVDPVEMWKDLEYSDDPVALFIMARNLLVAHGHESREAARRAVRLFDRAILLSPAHRMALYRGRAVSAAMSGDIDDAETAALAIRQRWPESPIAWYYSALALEVVERKRAEQAYLRAVELDADYARAHLGLGWVLVRDGRLEDGKRHLRTAVELAPDLAIAHVRLGYTLYGAGDVDEAHECIREAIRLGHDSPETRFNYGANQFWAGRPARGVAVARELLAARPGDVRLGVNLAACLVLAHRHDDALRVLKKLDAHGDAEALYISGLAHEESGRFDEADADYAAALAALGGGECEGEPPIAPRVDALRPRPRFPAFDAAEIAAQRVWCESRKRRLQELAADGQPGDAAEALAACLFRVTDGNVAQQAERIAALLVAAPDDQLTADHLVACIGLAAKASRSPEVVAPWIERALEHLEDECDGLRRGAERHVLLLGRRHSDDFKAILDRSDSEIRSLIEEMWSEIDDLLFPDGA